MNGAVPAWVYRDNGFGSMPAMLESHEPLLRLAETVLTNDAGNVLDLGCGNGWLLASLAKRFGGLTPFGIDRMEDRIDRARQLNAADAHRFQIGDLFSVPSLWPKIRFDLTFLMVGRLHGQSHSNVESLLAYLKSNSKNLILYAYDDWLEKYGDIVRMTRHVGLNLKPGIGLSNVALAQL